MPEKLDPARIIERYPNLSRDSLIPILQEVQDEFGYLSEKAIHEIGLHLDLPASKIYGLATFYNQFRFTPLGRYHITVCNGTACHLEGSGKLINEIEKILGIRDGETSRDGMFSMEVLSCIGACGQAPVIAINGEHYEAVTKERLKKLIKSIKESGEVL